MKPKEYFNQTKRLQNFKKCVGCSEIYPLDRKFAKCPQCKGNKFIPCTEYIYEPSAALEITPPTAKSGKCPQARRWDKDE